MSIALAFERLTHRPYRLRRVLGEAGSVMLGIALLVWSLAPIYEMFLIALDPDDGEVQFDGNLWPPDPSLNSFHAVVTQHARYLENFWHQFGNSVFIGVLTMLLTLAVGSLASFAVNRLRLTRPSLLSNAALLTYAVPASFVIAPYYRMMSAYGLLDSLWAVITAQVAFATPFAILILQLYGRLIPREIDDAARVEGATPVQVYLRIYLPMMMPALAIIAIFSLLLAWNDYLYQATLLSVQNMTVSVTQGQLFVDIDAPFNAMMAAAIIFVLPPIALLLALRRYVAEGLRMATSGG